MRRPDSIVGLTLHLARQRWGATTVRGVGLGLGFALAGALGAVALHRPAPQATVSPARPGRALAWGLGQCANDHATCASDAMCGAGDRCVDPLRLRERVRAGRALDDDAVTVFPHLAVDGDGYGVVWSAIGEDTGDIWFARLDGEGKRRGAAVQLTRGGALRLRPRLARGPTGWAVGWIEVGEDGVASRLLRLDVEGRAQGAPVAIGGAEFSVLSDVVASGSQYGVGYFSASATRQVSVHLARVGQQGAVGTPVTVAGNQLLLGHLGLGAAGGAFALGWNHYIPRDDRAETFVARVGADGAAGTALRVDAHAGRNGGLALDLNGAVVGAVWEDQYEEADDSIRNGLAFAGVNAEGRVVPRRAVTDRQAIHLEPSLVAAGAAHGLVYTRLDDDPPTVQFARLGADGARVGAAAQLNPRTSLAALGTLAWNGRAYAAAWTQFDADGITLRFARLDANGRRVGAIVPIGAR